MCIFLIHQKLSVMIKIYIYIFIVSKVSHDDFYIVFYSLCILHRMKKTKISCTNVVTQSISVGMLLQKRITNYCIIESCIFLHYKFDQCRVTYFFYNRHVFNKNAKIALKITKKYFKKFNLVSPFEPNMGKKIL